MTTDKPTSKLWWGAWAVVAAGSFLAGQHQVKHRTLRSSIEGEGIRVLMTMELLGGDGSIDGGMPLDQLPESFWLSNQWPGHAWRYEANDRLEIGEYTPTGGFLIWYSFEDEQWHYDS